MKPLPRILLAICLLSFLASNADAAGDSQKKMLRDAKVDRTHAEIIALGRVPGGKVKSSAIKEERGHLVWSFEVARPGAAEVTKVLVDARTGKVIALERAGATRKAQGVKSDRGKNH